MSLLRQKRPITVSKETYYSVKRDLLQCQKRPNPGRHSVIVANGKVSEDRIRRITKKRGGGEEEKNPEGIVSLLRMAILVTIGYAA